MLRFQQFTAPVMAKGFEDTALYRYYPLASLNEVGGEPGRVRHQRRCVSRMESRAPRQWPDALSATSTHDTKRSEDTRARIDVLSEIPDEWEQAIKRWYQMNSGARKTIEESEVPDPNEEYLLYQTLIGIWPDAPIGRGAARGLHQAHPGLHGKGGQGGQGPHQLDERQRGARSGAERVPRGRFSKDGTEFVADLARFQARIARAGMLNSLSQTILKIAAPGVPDFYQGTELWALSLVDPDNRRPVDYARRCAMLKKMREAARRDPLATTRHLLKDLSSGAIKMYLINRAMEFRRDNPDAVHARRLPSFEGHRTARQSHRRVRARP